MIKGETDRNIITTGGWAYPWFSTSVFLRIFTNHIVQNLVEIKVTETF